MNNESISILFQFTNATIFWDKKLIYQRNGFKKLDLIYCYFLQKKSCRRKIETHNLLLFINKAPNSANHYANKRVNLSESHFVYRSEKSLDNLGLVTLIFWFIQQKNKLISHNYLSFHQKTLKQILFFTVWASFEEYIFETRNWG